MRSSTPSMAMLRRFSRRHWDIFESMPIHNAAYSWFCEAVHGANFGLRKHPAIPKLSHHEDIVIGQVRSSSPVPAFFAHVLDVVHACPKPQVCGVTAWRVIAGVTDHCVSWVNPVHQKVRNTVGYQEFVRSIFAREKLPVPLRVCCADPLPALSRRFLLNIVPKLSDAPWREGWHSVCSHRISLTDCVVRAASGVVTQRCLFNVCASGAY